MSLAEVLLCVVLAIFAWGVVPFAKSVRDVRSWDRESEHRAAMTALKKARR